MKHEQLRRQAWFAFFRGRMAAAGTEILVAGFLIGAALLFANEPSFVVAPAALLLAVTAALTIQGRDAGKAVLPALLMGVVPLACSLGAQHLGHVCSSGGCSSLCVPLCSAGGLVAGLLLARQSRRARQPVVAWLSGGALVVMAGALGCVCVGAAGVVGMALGVLASAGVLAWPARPPSAA